MGFRFIHVDFGFLKEARVDSALLTPGSKGTKLGRLVQSPGVAMRYASAFDLGRGDRGRESVGGRGRVRPGRGGLREKGGWIVGACHEPCS